LKSQTKDSSLLSLESCLTDITNWLSHNKLVCNQEKTEILHLSSRFSQHTPLSISLNGTLIHPISETRDLGVVVDSHLQLTSHINKVCKAASLAIHKIGRIRKYLGKSEAERLAHAFITSKLDFCNSILYGLPAYQLDKLQRIQNTAARVVTRSKTTDHITPVLQDLHWLPVKQRIIFKILLITYKALHSLAPVYISELLQEYKPPRTLRSSSRNLLSVPRINTKQYGNCAFSFTAPTLWNNLPDNIKNINNLNEFKSSVKTLLFKSAFNRL